MKKLLTIILCALLLVTAVSAYDYSDAIDSDNDGVGIAPTTAYEDESIECVFNTTLSTPIYEWYKNDVLQSSRTGATVSSSYLTAGDEWQCTVYYEVYSPAIGYYEVTLGDETIVIQEAEEEVVEESTSAPRATDISISVEEGELVDIEVEYVDSFIMWSFYTTLTNNFESSTIYVYDKDSNETDLSYTYTTPLDTNGDWQTATGDVGTYTSIFTVTDEADNTGTADISITVSEAAEVENICPTVSVDDVTVTEGETVEASIEAQDADGGLGNSLTYTLVDAPAGAEISSLFTVTNHKVTWETEEGDAGEYTITVAVSDGECETEATFTVTVLEAEETENTCPTINVSNATVTEGETVSLVIETEDAEGDLLKYTFVDGPTNATISRNDFAINGNPTFTWETEEGDAGEYAIIIAVSDGECVTEVTFTVTVESVPTTTEDNTAPVLDDIADIEVEEGETVYIEANATDAEGDDLTFTFEGIDGEQDDNAWTWETNFNDAGLYTVTVTVSDGELTDSTTLQVKVNDLCTDKNENDICDDEEVSISNYEGDLLSVNEVTILNANNLYSAYNLNGLEVEATGDYYVENGYLYDSNSDNQIVVYLELENRNSFDANGILVTFIIEGEEYTASFVDLDRSETESAIYYIDIPADLETGKYGLTVLVESEDIDAKAVFNLNIESLADLIVEPVNDTSVEGLSLWEKFLDWLDNIF